MTSYIKGALGYITPGSKTTPDSPTRETVSPAAGEPSLPPAEDDSKEKEQQQQGYLKRAASGVLTVGSSTVGAGVSGVKWIAGASYNVGSGVVGAVGSVAGSAAGAVGTGASVVLSKVTPSKSSKEHSD